MKRWRARAASALVCAAAAASGLHAAEPLAEAGGGLVYVDVPAYPGASSRYRLLLPTPYFIYRGPRLRVGRAGLRYALDRRGRTRIELSLGGGWPVGGRSPEREGMPPIRWWLEAGPRLSFTAWQSAASRLDLRAFLRAAVDITGRGMGWAAGPEIVWRYRKQGWSLHASADLRWNSKRFHATLYGVPSAYARPRRPAFAARGGLHSWGASLWTSWRFRNGARIFAGMSVRDLSVGVVARSPLVRRRMAVSAAAGFVAKLWETEARGEGDEE